MSAEAKDREDDRAILTAALERATTDYRKKYPNPPILRPSPTKEILDALGEAIDRCKSYQGVAGKVLFNGTSGPIITPALLAPRLFDHSDRLNDQFEWKEDLPGAADWLIHLLTTEKTEGRFKVAVWGLSVAEELTIMEQTRILPFDALADSYMKSHILDRAKDNRGDVVWLSQRFYGRPGVAVETVVTDFPLIGTDGACFARIAKLQLVSRHRGFDSLGLA